MRIAMIGCRGVPARHGGIERVVEELGAELASRGHEVIVFGRAKDYVEHPTHYRGMRLRWLPSGWGRGLETIINTTIATALCAGRGFDVMHFHGMGPSLISPLARVVSRAGVVATIHGMDDERAKWGLLARTTLRMGAWSSAKAPHEVIVVSRALNRVYQARYSRHTNVIGNGVRVDHAPDVEGVVSAELGLEPRSYVLHVGRLVPEKRADLLLEAYRGLDTTMPLVIVGSDGESPEFTARVHGLAVADSRVRLLPVAPRSTVEALYAGAAAFVLPSDLEGMPLVLLEAAAYGCPVLASDIEPHVEFLEQDRLGGHLFPSGDVQALTKALSAMIVTVPDELAGAVVLQQKVRANNDWARIAAETEQVYSSAIRAR